MREKVQHSNQFQVHLLYEGEIVDVLFNYLSLIIKENYVQSMLIPKRKRKFLKLILRNHKEKLILP